MIEELARRFDLPDPAGEQLEALVACVSGHPEAPTTVTDRGGIIRDHLADSLVALELAEVREAVRLADVGAGAGFPGLPLAIALPDAHVSLLESNGRKCAFMAHAIEVCGVPNARPVHTRAEAWADGMEVCDLVTARALAPLAVVAEYAAPLLRLGGALVAWRGRRDPDEEAAGARAASQLGLAPSEPLRVVPYRGAVNRHLHVMRKAAPTPEGFPRRPGMARKRPLGAPSDRRQR